MQTDQFSGGCSVDDRRRELELELIKVRSEAEAARLEARAAELELTIRRMSRSADLPPHAMTRPDVSHSISPAPSFSGEVTPAASRPTIASPSATVDNAETSVTSTIAFSSWDAVRAATPAASCLPVAEPPIHDVNVSSQAITRVDPTATEVRRPHLLDIDEAANQEVIGTESEAATDDEKIATVTGSTTAAADEIAVPAAGAASLPAPALLDSSAAEPRSEISTADVGEFAIDDDAAADDSERRRSPAALLVSTILHVVILIALAAFTLGNRKPKDQVALAASISNPNEVSMQTFEIETSEPKNEPAEPTPSETDYELSPVGELKVTELAPDARPAPPAPAAAMLSTSQLSAASMALKSDSKAKIQFCGVEGGGNHFVYLVDSSGSMGSGFESARAELLSSIDVLKPDQRFYVVFFDAEPDYMRLSDPNQDESRSAYATADNKQALKRWAMRITKNKGRAPYDPLKFALKLKPDVIFLLSDGEFPQGIEDLLKETNRVENLFGDSHPISIVHTIGYHSREGESRMRRIAEQNQGQYRHVPKP